MSRRSAPRPMALPWSWLEIPVLDETRCTGCGRCVAVCPVDCLEMRGPLPHLSRPAHCISCAVCVCVCPADALDMRRLQE